MDALNALLGLFTRHSLQMVGGLSLLTYWFMEVRRREKYEASITNYMDAKKLIDLLDIQFQIMQAQLSSTHLLGVAMNRNQAIINNRLSFLETTAELYGLYESKTEEREECRNQVLHYYRGYILEFFRLRGQNPAFLLSDSELQTMGIRLERTRKYMNLFYQKKILGDTINLTGNFDTSSRLKYLKKQERCFFYLTSLLFILGTFASWLK